MSVKPQVGEPRLGPGLEVSHLPFAQYHSLAEPYLVYDTPSGEGYGVGPTRTESWCTYGVVVDQKRKISMDKWSTRIPTSSKNRAKLEAEKELAREATLARQQKYEELLRTGKVQQFSIGETTKYRQKAKKKTGQTTRSTKNSGWKLGKSPSDYR